MLHLSVLTTSPSLALSSLLLQLFSVEDSLGYSIHLSINLQAYSSDEEEEMLIVVLDDDDDLVVGKSKQATGTANSYNTNNASSQARSRTNSQQRNSRNGSGNTHHRNSPGKSSRHRDHPNKSKNQNYNNRDQRNTNGRPQQRPQIDTQKLSQRLNNIKQEQSRQSSRAGSPRTDRGLGERSPSLTGSMHSSYSDPGIVVDKPRAVIAKPVERRRKKRRPRPEPEGASWDPADLDELDKLLYNDEPIFSDYGTEDEADSAGTTRQRQSGFSIAAFAIGLGLNSNTMIKYTIISTELQNIVRVSLKMVRRSYLLMVWYSLLDLALIGQLLLVLLGHCSSSSSHIMFIPTAPFSLAHTHR